MSNGKNIVRLTISLLMIMIYTGCQMEPTSTETDYMFTQIKNTSNWKIFKTVNSRSLEDITTYQTNGLVTDYLSSVVSNGSILAVGSLETGFSFIHLDDVESPKGKVTSYTGPESSNTEERFGLSGFAVHPTTEDIYAWYGSEIIEVESLSRVYDSAPDYTHSYYGTGPLNRFVIDDEGAFWIGTSNLESEGTQDGDNGLYCITLEGNGSKEKIIDEAIWHVMKDSSGTIWVSAYTGLYKISDNQVPIKISPPEEGSFFEQAIEFEGDIYTVVKNFFHNPKEISTKFKLYKYVDDSEGTSFEFINDITADDEDYYDQTRAFIFDNKLYFRLNGSLRSLTTNDEISNDTILGLDGNVLGEDCLYSQENTLFSVGNFEGVSILDSLNHYILNQANTAEQLISDNIHVIHVSEDGGKVFVGPSHAGGFSYFTNTIFTTVPFPNEVVISGFFEYNDQLYVQGARTLGILGENSITPEVRFSTNGERTTYDPSGYLWAFPNFGSGTNGVIGMMNLKNHKILRVKEPDGNDYWESSGDTSTNAENYWDFDQRYHFNDVKAIPGTQEIMIGVSEGTGDFETTPHTLQYSYSDNTFTKIYIPDSESEGIMVMAAYDSSLYGVARQKFYKLEDSEWEKQFNIKLGNDFRDMVIFDSYAVIASGWNTSGSGDSKGIEIINLETGISYHYTSDDIPLPSDAVFALEVQQINNDSVRLWFGTFDGIAYCDVILN